MNTKYGNRIYDFKMFKMNENKDDDIINIISTIDSYPKEIIINKPYMVYENSLETAISNSEITRFYLNYQRTIKKRYIKKIPFPFDKLNDNLKRFDKLNRICQIYEKYTDLNLKLVKSKSLHLMDIILYDMYFDVKSRKYNIYEIVDNLVIPDEGNDNECEKFGLWFTNIENPIGYIIFYTSNNGIVSTIMDNF